MCSYITTGVERAGGGGGDGGLLNGLDVGVRPKP